MPNYLQYGAGGTMLGHYQVAQRSGEIAATLGAAAHLARIRWSPSTIGTRLVLERLKVGISFSGAVTTAVEMTMRAIVVRGFTVDFTTNMTSINMSTTSRTNTMRSEYMQNSQMGASGPGICTTAAISGQTLTADAAPFAITPIPTLIASTATGTAVALPVGQASNMITLYECTAFGQHQVSLQAGEGIVVQSHLAGPGSGTFALYTEWTWAEVFQF